MLFELGPAFLTRHMSSTYGRYVQQLFFFFPKFLSEAKRYAVTGPDNTLRLQKGQVPTTSRQSAHEDVKAC